MAYDPKAFAKGASYGGGWPGMKKGDSKRPPQNYAGKYTRNLGALGPGDDGKEHPSIAPKQGFRKDLPRPEVSGRLMDGEAYADGDAPTHDEIQKRWR
jgi:hypothetical protein